MSTSLLARIYAAEEALTPAARLAASWRLSPDIRDALRELSPYHLTPPAKFTLIGYPAKVDESLPPDTIVLDGWPMVAP